MSGVTKSFGDKQVLCGIDIEVASEESLAIIGTSGCGKSVTLKCLLGLLRADGGSIKVDGEEMIRAGRHQLEAMRRRFGMTFQFGALFDSLPIWENVTFRLRQQQTMTRQQARDLAAETITQLGLAAHVIDQYPAELSGGMQKRVALARALAPRPSGDPARRALCRTGQPPSRAYPRPDAACAEGGGNRRADGDA